MTRDKIIALGKKFMQTVGYNVFNYKLIAAELNIRNASIHYHFPTKEDLALAVIEKDKEDFNKMAAGLEQQSATAKINALLNIYTQYFREGEKLCVISTFASSFNDVSGSIQQASREYGALVTQWLTDIFHEGAVSGEFNAAQDAEDLAALWMASLPGSLLVGRMHGEAFFEQVINRLKSTLQAP
jgi:TetR/AcrR family transcriptional repressor of nem operon